MSYTVALLPGDGIGPEVCAATRRVVAATGVALRWDEQLAGAAAVADGREPLPQETLDAIERHGVALKGPVTTPVGRGFRSVNVQLRQTLQLYANLRPVRSLPGVPTRFSEVDLVVVRENTEGLYSGIEHVVVPGVVESLKIITENASTRIARFAFDHALRHGRRRITAVHKANIMKLSDGLFLECFRRVAGDRPQVAADDLIIDNLCMQLVMRPETFDVLLLENLYGDIVSDLCAGLVGGLGVVAGANLGDRIGVFEAVHGSAPDIAGRNVANPLALIFSAVLMLRHLGETAAAARIETAVDAVLTAGKVRTPDLGGEATTDGFADALVAAIEAA